MGTFGGSADFEGWMHKHGRNYATSEERAAREQNFNAYVAQMALTARANPLAMYSLDEFADWSSEELQGLRGFQAEAAEAAYNRSEHIDSVLTAEEPGAIDWVQKGAVTTPTSQGRCATCMLFSGTASVEGAWFLAGNPLTKLSEQEMIDCGGGPGYAMDWVIQNGLASNKTAPLANHKDPTLKGCRGVTNCTHALAHPTVPNINQSQHLTGLKCLKSHEEPGILAQLQHGPISVSIASGYFAGYHGGIINCTASGIDHAVLLVGYGEENGTKYWKLKNSWGPAFGEGGYFRFQYGNTCLRGACQAYIGKPPPTNEVLVV